MSKFFAIYRIPVATLDEWREKTDPKEVEKQSKKMMDDMNAWMEKHADSFVERGQPLGKTKTVTNQGVSDSRNDLNYYQIVEADSHAAAAKIFVDCPHVQIPNSFIDIMEIPNM